MNQLISNIKNIPGVIGVAIFKDNGALAAFDFPAAYDQNLLKLIGPKFQPIKEIFPKDEGEIVYLCWEFEDILGFYYPVEGGWVNIISSENIPMPVFTLTMTAVSKKLPQLLAGTEGMKEQPQAQPVSAPTGETISPAKIEELEKLFAIYLGPAAPVIFKRVAIHLGFTLDTIPVNSLKRFLDDVIAKAPETKKNEILEKTQKIVPEIKE